MQTERVQSSTSGLSRLGKLFTSRSRTAITTAWLCVLASCGGGDGGTAPPPPEPPPANLTYAPEAGYLIGDAIASLTPTVTGHVTAYSVSPALPEGLSLDANTGIVSGNPQAEADAASFVVTASNSAGSTSSTLTLSIAAKEHVEKASVGSLTLQGVDPTQFVALSTVLQFAAQGASLAADVHAARVWNNGVEVSRDALMLSDGVLSVSGALHDGLNVVQVAFEDGEGGQLSFQGDVWAGSNVLTVNIVHADGTPALDAAVTVKQMDQQGLTFQRTTTSGQLVLQNVPTRTLTITASDTAGHEQGALSTTGNAGTIQVRLLGFNTASAVDNNDFHLGTEGWTPDRPGIMAIVAHVEDIQVGVATIATHPLNGSRANDRARAAASRVRHVRIAAVAQAADADGDLSLTTQGEGPATVTRTFTVAPGVSAVTLRYRFVTSEVPGGYFGSEFNDSYSIAFRSQASQSITQAHSMNELGLGAFSADGSTSWQTVKLPVDAGGDTVQLDLAVTNVGDGILDSQVIVDSVIDEELTVTSDVDSACENEKITFTAHGKSSDSAGWSGGGTPATGSGVTFGTLFTASGDHAISAKVDAKTAQKSIHVKSASGASWVALYPTSTSLSDLVAPFQANATAFISAMQAAGATVSISATYRPAERAYLMHYAYLVAHDGMDAASVPALAGVEICWVHRDSSGNVDSAASRAGAQAMVNGYGIAYAPALVSRHTQRLAVDMSIGWSGDLSIAGQDGKTAAITSTPRSGANVDLQAVGAGYSVIKLANDPPHWSDDGH